MTAMAHLTCAAHTRAELTTIIDALPRLRHREHPRPRRRSAGRPRSPARRARSTRSSSSASSATSATSRSASPRTRSRIRARPIDRGPAAHTAEKLAEADFAITQFFFDADHYFDLVDSLHALGVDKPVIPGIMPVPSVAAIKRMTRDAGLGVPGVARPTSSTRSSDDPAAVRRVGIEEATKLCRELLDRRRAGPALLHAEPLDRDPGDLRRTSGCNRRREAFASGLAYLTLSGYIAHGQREAASLTGRGGDPPGCIWSPGPVGSQWRTRRPLCRAQGRADDEGVLGYWVRVRTGQRVVGQCVVFWHARSRAGAAGRRRTVPARERAARGPHGRDRRSLRSLDRATTSTACAPR